MRAQAESGHAGCDGGGASRNAAPGAQQATQLQQHTHRARQGRTGRHCSCAHLNPRFGVWEAGG
eukprot:2203146-Prymnesium_polylepis.1